MYHYSSIKVSTHDFSFDFQITKSSDFGRSGTSVPFFELSYFVYYVEGRKIEFLLRNSTKCTTKMKDSSLEKFLVYSRSAVCTSVRKEALKALLVVTV